MITMLNSSFEAHYHCVHLIRDILPRSPSKNPSASLYLSLFKRDDNYYFILAIIRNHNISIDRNRKATPTQLCSSILKTLRTSYYYY